MREFSGIAVGGPADGELLKSNEPTMRVPYPSKFYFQVGDLSECACPKLKCCVYKYAEYLLDGVELQGKWIAETEHPIFDKVTIFDTREGHEIRNHQR